MPSPAGNREHSTQAFSEHIGGGMLEGAPKTDETLEHPRTVFRQLMRHYARYTPEMVEQVCGISQDDFLRVAEALVANSGRERTTVFCYALGWTQHTSGVQMIRAAAILQLLLGNMGRPGGGIMAMRGHASIQGSTDIPTLFDLLPGYLPMPKGREEELDLADLRGVERRRARLVVELRQVHRVAAEGLLRRRRHAGERLRLPPPAEDHRQPLALPDDAARARRRPRRPVRDGPEPGRRLPALRAAAARARPPEVAGGARPLRARDRDVLARRPGGPLGRVPHGGHPDRGLPDAGRLAHREGRPLHQHAAAAAVARQGDRAARRRALGAVVHAPPVASACASTTTAPTPTATGRSSTSSGTTPRSARSAIPTPRPCCARSTATTSSRGEPVSGFAALKNDGSTACGCWIYSGCYADGVNQTRRREPGDLDAPGGWVSPEWAWAWPANRRMLYNRASADPEGKPWSERKRYVWWDAAEEKWAGYDVPGLPAPTSRRTTSRSRTPRAWTRSPAPTRSS